MARSITARRRLVPEKLREFLRQALTRAGGLALLALGAALLLALISYDPADPSFNNVTARAPVNWLGLWGAYAADVLLQTLGLAGALIGLALMAWGGQVAGRTRVIRPVLRVMLLPVAALATAVALAALPLPAAWPLRTGLGGVMGAMGLAQGAMILASFDVPGAAFWVAGAGGVLGMAAFIAALGFTGAEWSWMGGHLGAGSRIAAEAGARGATMAGRGLMRATRWSAAGLRSLAGSARARWPEMRREPRLTDDEPPEIDERLAEPPPSEPMSKARPEPFLAALPRKTPEVLPRSVPKPSKRAEAAKQRSLAFSTDDYELPGLDLLTEPPARRQAAQSEEALRQNARMLETVLEDFGVKGEIVQVRPGPVVTLYELEPAPGVKTSRVVALADDIARSMSKVSARVAVVPGRNAIGIELPNVERETVYLREMLGSIAYERSTGKLPLVLGKDIGGAPQIVDLSRMPHLLIAGTTGSGKSVAINAMVLSLLYRLTPDECKLIMIDPKMLELSVYEGIPHLIAPVVTEPKKAIVALKWAVREMEQRYRNMSKLGVRNIVNYNERVVEARRRGEVLSRRVHTGYDEETGKPVYEDEPLELQPMPYIVIVVDEMADLMLTAGKDIEAVIQRLAQMARAAGLHLIMATQRPSVDVITGTIKANFPNRISFQVTSKIDSRTILGEPGAEQLLGQGDMLHMSAGGRIQRIHGPFVSDSEVEAVAEALRRQGEPSYLQAVTEEEDTEDGFAGENGEREGYDELYDEAVALVIREGKASTSFVQRYLQIGYNRAARIIEQMEREGVVSPADRVGRREVLAPNRDEATG